MVKLLLLLALTSAPTAADELEARRSYEKALRYYRAEEPQAALPLFQRAYELSGQRPSTILALAQCERQLRRFDDALRHYEEYLATGLRRAEQNRVRDTVELVREQKARWEAELRALEAAAKDAEERLRKAQEAARLAEELANQAIASAADAARRAAEEAAQRAADEAARQALLQATRAENKPIPVVEDGPNVLSHPLFWVIAGVVLMGGAAAVGVVASSSSPYAGSTDVLLRPLEPR